MNELILITGGSSGIGRALSLYFAKNNYDVIIIGRHEDKLEEVKCIYPHHIDYVATDISNKNTPVVISNKIGSRKVKILVHNAAVLSPVGNVLEVNDEELNYHFAVNFIAPFNITKKLLSKMVEKGRIFHMSSGAAYSAIPGWGCYCITKASLAMLYKVLKNDLKKYNLLIGSSSPGVVDTPMQELIRSLDPSIFPLVAKFDLLKKNNKLLNPEVVAKKIGWLLLEADDETFTKQDWNIEDLK